MLPVTATVGDHLVALEAGRIEKGFDFLGYRFTPRSLTVAQRTIENLLERALRLYGQEPGKDGAPHGLNRRVAEPRLSWSVLSAACRWPSAQSNQ